MTLQCQQAPDSILVVGLTSLTTGAEDTAAQDTAAMLTSSVSTLTMIFMSVFSSRPDRVFFMGLNLLTKMSMSPVSRAWACCSVRPHVANGGRTKTADAICRQQQSMAQHIARFAGHGGSWRTERIRAISQVSSPPPLLLSHIVSQAARQE